MSPSTAISEIVGIWDSSREELNLSGAKFNDKQRKWLLDLIKGESFQFKGLDLSNNPSLSGESWRQIANALKENTSLTKIVMYVYE